MHGGRYYVQPSDEEMMIYAANWIFTVDAVSNEVGASC